MRLRLAGMVTKKDADTIDMTLVLRRSRTYVAATWAKSW
jgi:hypothetical protein